MKFVCEAVGYRKWLSGFNEKNSSEGRQPELSEKIELAMKFNSRAEAMEEVKEIPYPFFVNQLKE